ncbi:MAG: guanylate kinase [Microscillaceae bacterium]|nr:guanylate kinase [Microscillaceae bacterium]
MAASFSGQCPGKAIIFSAPSGAGKTTLVRHLLAHNSQLGFSVSACTRAQRPGEVEGRDYYFLSPQDFEQKIAQEAFVEWEEVYRGLYYGTLKSEIERLWSNGKHVLFDVDVKGGLKLKSYFQDQALAIFVSVASPEVLAQRLRQRNTDPEEKIRERIAKYREELAFEPYFDRVLVNEDLPQTLHEAEKLVQDFIASAPLIRP